jgi:hypothetical protein
MDVRDILVRGKQQQRPGIVGLERSSGMPPLPAMSLHRTALNKPATTDFRRPKPAMNRHRPDPTRAQFKNLGGIWN